VEKPGHVVDSKKRRCPGALSYFDCVNILERRIRLVGDEVKDSSS